MTKYTFCAFFFASKNISALQK